MISSAAKVLLPSYNPRHNKESYYEECQEYQDSNEPNPQPMSPIASSLPRYYPDNAGPGYLRLFFGTNRLEL